VFWPQSAPDRWDDPAAQWCHAEVQRYGDGGGVEFLVGMFAFCRVRGEIDDRRSSTGASLPAVAMGEAQGAGAKWEGCVASSAAR